MSGGSGGQQRVGLTFTTRAAVLALALCAALLLLAYPVKAYLAQRAQISSAQQQQQRLAASVAALKAQHARNLTATATAADAQARLHFVFPGQPNLITLPPPVRPPATTVAGHARVRQDPDATWYGRLWDSAASAGR